MIYNQCQAFPVFVWFAFSILHRSGRAVKCIIYTESKPNNKSERGLEMRLQYLLFTGALLLNQILYLNMFGRRMVT